MKNKDNNINLYRLIGALLVSCLISISAAACSGPFALSEATTCTGIDKNMMPINPTTSFDSNISDINVSLKAENAPSNTEIRAELFYVKGAASQSSRLVSATRATVKGTTYIGLTFTRGSIAVWPVGEYRVDIYVDGNKSLDLFFTVTD